MHELFGDFFIKCIQHWSHEEKVAKYIRIKQYFFFILQKDYLEVSCWISGKVNVLQCVFVMHKGFVLFSWCIRKHLSSICDYANICEDITFIFYAKCLGFDNNRDKQKIVAN